MKRIYSTQGLILGQLLKAGRKKNVVIVERIWNESNIILTTCGIYFDLTTHRVYTYKPVPMDDYDISHHGVDNIS